MASEESYPKLISLAVHELRSPASVISGYLRMLQRDTDAPLNDRQRKMVEEAENRGRLVALIAALSDRQDCDAGQREETIVFTSRGKKNEVERELWRSESDRRCEQGQELRAVSVFMPLRKKPGRHRRRRAAARQERATLSVIVVAKSRA